MSNTIFVDIELHSINTENTCDSESESIPSIEINNHMNENKVDSDSDSFSDAEQVINHNKNVSLYEIGSPIRTVNEGV